MTWKNIGSVILIVIGFIAFKYGYKVITEGPEIASFEEIDWKNSAYENVTLDAPFELDYMEMEIPFTMQSLVSEVKFFEYESRALVVFVAKFVYNPGIPVDIDGAVAGAMAELEGDEGVEDFKFDVIPLRKNNVDGRKVTGNFKTEEGDKEFILEIYVKKSKLIQVLIANTSHAENRAIRNRIFESLSVNM
jgi:hypothetical protein